MKNHQVHPSQDPNICQDLKEIHLCADLKENIARMKSILHNVDIAQYREFETLINHKIVQMCFIYLDGVVNSEIIDGYILKPIMGEHITEKGKTTVDYLLDRVIQINSVKKLATVSEMIDGILYGDSLLLVDGCSQGILMDTKQFTTRSISEPDGEKILSGPREGFSESLMQNLSLVRRKLRTPELKMQFYSVGQRSNTQLCITYMQGLVKQETLDLLYKRLEKIDIDAILDANYITELVRDNAYSIFRTTGYTERPDVVAGKLLEGRIAIFVDGTPVVLTVPYLFIENFQSNEDYYLNFYYTSFSRLLRIAGFFLSIIIPAFYVAMVSFHQEILPKPLLTNIAADTHNVPFPAALEALLLLIMFDLLRETGIRMPLGVGQALSIVGALVVGSAAVEADLISAPMIIITAISGIASLLIPKMNAPVVLSRIVLLLVASLFGLYGLILGLAILLIHILKLESFGVAQLTQDKPYTYQRIKDTFIRAPWWQMRTRPWALTKNKTRQN